MLFTIKKNYIFILVFSYNVHAEKRKKSKRKLKYLNYEKTKSER
jgi:hypothetical protein